MQFSCFLVSAASKLDSEIAESASGTFFYRFHATVSLPRKTQTESKDKGTLFSGSTAELPQDVKVQMLREYIWVVVYRGAVLYWGPKTKPRLQLNFP